MAKPRGVEAKLLRLRSIRDAPLAPETVLEMLRQGLEDRSNLVVAEAASLIGDKEVKELTAELVRSFERLMIEPEESDKQCRGKIAIVQALNKLQYTGPEVFLRGISYAMAPRWGEDEDAAGPLRALCALGLATTSHADVLHRLTDLLLDRDKVARAGAVRGLGGAGSLAAIPLLRFKAQLGDKEPDVMAECFTALLALAPAESLPFVGRFLNADDSAVREAAVFALAESRRPEALALLKDFWPRSPPALQEAVLLAIAMLRLPAAIDFLIGLIAQKDPQTRAALSALAIHRHTVRIKDRVATAVAANGEPTVRQWFENKF
jgi:HEAT repeat protein